jgi:uncharacterized membrane protein
MKRTVSIEHKASRVLRAGIWSSGILMALGLLLVLLQGGRVEVLPGNVSISQILRFALAEPVHPLTLLYAGLLVLMFTPILRVVAALIGFFGERDRWFVVVSTLVLSLLLCEIGYAFFLK